MNEQKEKEIKTKLINFIRENFEFEGEPVAVQNKLYDTNEKLYQLVLEIMGIPPEKLSTGMPLQKI